MTRDWKDCKNDREKYALYLASREWAVLKEAVRKRSGGICERCGLHPMDHVHHLLYTRKYNEHLDDLQAICLGCHEFTHAKSDRDPKAARTWDTDFKVLSESNWTLPAVCVGLADLGFHEIHFPNEHLFSDGFPLVRVLVVIWELFDHPFSPVLFNKGYCWSMDSPSPFFRLVSSWLDRSFDDCERFDPHVLLSSQCQLVHSASDTLLLASPHNGKPLSPSYSPVAWSALHNGGSPPEWFPPFRNRPMSSWYASSFAPVHLLANRS